MNLSKLFVVHAVVTFAAGVVLILWPELIPRTVDIHLAPEARLLAYFLGAAELALAVLSWGARRITDFAALRLIVVTFIVFHGVTAALELVVTLQRPSSVLVANIVARVVIGALFDGFGELRTRSG